MNRRLQADFALAACTLLWGGTFVVVQRALADSSVFAFLAARFSVAALLIAAIFRADLRKLSSAQVWVGVRIGMLMFTGYVFQTVGLLCTAPSKVAFVTGLSVVLVPILMALFWRHHASTWIWVGALASLAGLYYLTVPAAGFTDLNSGDLLVFVCAVMFAFHIIFIGRYSTSFTAGTLSFLQVATTAVLSIAALPLLAATGGKFLRFHVTLGLAVAILVTAGLATAVAFPLQVWAQTRATVMHTALILSLEPLFAGLISFFVVRERLGTKALAGAALIFAGIFLVELKGPALVATDSPVGFAFQPTNPVQENQRSGPRSRKDI